MRALLVLSLTIFTHAAWGWGSQGHKIVAQVAENNLTAKAKLAVAKVLKGQTLADVANWADSIRADADWAHTKPWHFVDIPDGEDYGTAEHSHEGDIVTAITEMIAVIKSSTTTALEKENALKFIVHFVGDIHQPLHVGRPDDRGGNSTRVKFEGKSTNLHSVWDSAFIKKSPLSHVEYADSLEQKTYVLAPYDLPEISFSKIIQECMGARVDIYNFGADHVISTQYYKKNLALMNAQLLVGGKRLAEILNKVYR